MNNYFLMIKSGSDVPDIEEEVEAKSKKEAVDIFYKWLGSSINGWNRELIERNTYKESEMVS